MKKLLARLSETKTSRFLFVAAILIVYLCCIPSVLRAVKEQKQTEAVSVEQVSAEEVLAAVEAEEPEASSTPAPAVPAVTRAPDIQLGDLPARAGEFGDFTFSNMDYFSDALFIGDSRMRYMYLYGTIKNADFYAANGMDVFDLRSKASECDGTDMSFEQYLHHKQYGKVYLMLGLNDLGYDRVTFYKKYKALVQEIREAQPDAIIFLQANLLLSEEESRKSNVSNNRALIDVNNIIATLANGVDIVYIDVNSMFTDETGNVRKSYTNEGIHLYAKYYEEWCRWLLTKTVVR